MLVTADRSHALTLRAGQPDTGPVETRHRARLAAAQHAHDAKDLRHLLDVLGLWPASDTPGDD